MPKEMSQIYLHGICMDKYYNSKMTLSILSQILKSGSLLSLRLQDKPSKKGFNGLDYISLCDYEKRELSNENANQLLLDYNLKFYNAFNSYIRNSLSLVFPKDHLEVITPKIVGVCSGNWEGFKNMHVLGESEGERYSDMPDEVQVRDNISLENLIGLTFPTHQICDYTFTDAQTIKEVSRHLKKIKLLLIKYNYPVKIYDIDTFEELSDESSIKQLIKSKNTSYPKQK